MKYRVFEIRAQIRTTPIGYDPTVGTDDASIELELPVNIDFSTVIKAVQEKLNELAAEEW